MADRSLPGPELIQLAEAVAVDEITGTVLVIISFATIKLPNYSDEK